MRPLVEGNPIRCLVPFCILWQPGQHEFAVGVRLYLDAQSGARNARCEREVDAGGFKYLSHHQFLNQVFRGV